MAGHVRRQPIPRGISDLFVRFLSDFSKCSRVAFGHQSCVGPLVLPLLPPPVSSSAFDATVRRSSPAPAVLAYICSDSNFTLREAPLSIKSFLSTRVYIYIFLPRSLLAVQPLSDLQPAPGCCCPGGADDVERNFWGGEDTIKPDAESGVARARICKAASAA